MNKVLKFFRNLAIFLMILGISFSNIPFNALSFLIDSYEKTSGVVDKIWLLEQNHDSDIVDKFISIRNISEKLRIHEAMAAAPTVANRSAIVAGTSGNLSLVLMATIDPNDIIVIATTVWAPNTASDVVAFAAPSGYTLIAQTGTPVTTPIDGQTAFFWKRAVGTEDGTTVTVTRPTGADTGTDTAFSAIAYRLTGAETSGNPWDGAVMAGPSNATTVTYNAMTVSGSERTLLAIQAIQDNVAIATPPSGYTVLGAADNSTTGTDTGYAAYYKNNVSSDGSVTNTITAPAQGRWVSMHISFKPVPVVTTISNFVSGEPGNSTIAPAASGMVDSFGLQTSGSTDTVSAATVGIAAGMGQYIQTVAITNDGDTVTYCSAAPSGDSASLSTCGIPVSTTNTQFKIKLTAKAHASMPAPDGGLYNVTATVTGFTSGNSQSGTDSGSSTLTIDNDSPAGTTGAEATSGENAQSVVSWTNPGDGDFQQVYIYCKTSSLLSGEAPTEGTDPVAGSTCDGTARLRYKGTTSPQTITGLTNGQIYYFRIYGRDTNGNFTAYSATQEVFGTPSAPATTLTISASAGSKVANVDSGATSQFVHDTGCSSDATCAAFKLAASGGAVSVTSITVTEGNASLDADTDLSNAALIYDTDANYSNGTAGTFGTDATFTSQAVTFTNAGLSIPNGSTYYFYIRTDFANGTAQPDGGVTVSFQITAANVVSDGTESGTGALAGSTMILPNVTSITYPITSPLNGARIGQGITINGAGFGTTCDGTDNRVTIGGASNVVSCTGTTFSDTSISITNFQYSSGDSYGGATSLLVGINATDDNASQDMYVYPDITDVTNPTAYTNAAREYSASDSDGVITINGNHFGTSQSSGSVTVLGQTASIVSWGATAIQIQIPTTIDDATYTGNIVVYQGTGGNSSASDTYGGGTYRILPRILFTGPGVDAKGGQGQGVTINGNHFCQDGNCADYATDSDDATFNAVSGKASYVTVSNFDIFLSVPATATDGNLIVTSDSANNGATYTSNNYFYDVKFGPSTPTGSSAGGSNNPTLSGSAFSDGTDGDTHYKTNWQLAHNTDGDWSTPEWVSTSTSAEVSTVVNTTNGVFINGDSGQTTLDCGTTYKGRVRYMDDGNSGVDVETWEWSSYSANYTFSTASCNASPAISISQPPSGNVNVSQGDSYNITYTLSDTDDIVVANFYYDTNNSGLDGAAITGCQNQAEGTNAICAWNTAGYPLGTYYIYGTSTDSVNPPVNAYSAGTITIQAPPQVTASSVGTQTVNLDSGAVNQYVGAAFTFQQNNGTADTITALTISEMGTASASSTLSTNAGVRYETGMASCIYNGTETLISGTFNNSDKMVLSAISIPVTLSANYTCVYVVFDIASSTVGGQTIDFEITSSTDFTLQNSTTKAGTYPIQLSGSTTVRPNVISVNYPVGGDGGREGDTFAINGAGFGTVAGSVTIQIGSDSITTNSANNTVATGTIQSAFPDTNNGGTNQFLVTVGGTADNASSTFYVYPDITDVTNPTAYTNAAREYSASDSNGIVTVNGIHFGTDGAVTVLGQTATTTITATCTGSAYQNTCVGIQIPTTISDSSYLGNIILTRSSDSKTDTYGGGNYRILPRIISINPTSGEQNNELTIIGNHFCQAGEVSCPNAFSYVSPINNALFGATNALNPAVWNWANSVVNVKVPAGSGVVAVKVISNDYESDTTNFSYLATTPADPTDLKQFKSDGSTLLNVGDGTNETTVVLKGDSSASTTITMFLEIEEKPIAQAFNGTITASSSSQTNTIFNDVPVTVSGLSDATQYHWRMRAKNANTGETSNWVAFGSNPSGDGSGDGSPAITDFYIDVSGPTISATTNANTSDIQSDITWTTGENATRQVAYGTGSCPTGQASAAATFSALANKEPSSPTGSGTSHTVTLNSLSANTTYYYIVRSADGFNNFTYDPPTANTCKNFNTLTAQTRLIKTLEYFVQQATSTGTGAYPVNFIPFISEANSTRTNITFKSIMVEVFGLSKGGSGNITINVDFTAGLTPSGATSYTLSDPGAFATPWNIIKTATSLNYNCPGCSSASNNTIDVTVSGATATSLVGAKIYITYYYVPQQ